MKDAAPTAAVGHSFHRGAKERLCERLEAPAPVLPADVARPVWHDGAWLQRRARFRPLSSPINLYQVHPGSWRRRGNGARLTDEAFADQLIPYAVEMGYTHIELLGALPGAPDAFFQPDGLRALVDRCHEAKLGVVLEIALTAESLRLLPSELLAPLADYHADGLCVSGVRSLLGGSEWIRRGTRSALRAIVFLRVLNDAAAADFPGAMMISRESVSCPVAAAPTALGGLGFTFAWDDRWQSDTLRYAALEPDFRRYHHDLLTFSFEPGAPRILPIACDAAATTGLIERMPGDPWRKFAGFRALMGYTMAHPGKKLLFMGCEFAQLIGWNRQEQLDWFLLAYGRHPQAWACVKALNRFYLATPALYERDESGFCWISARDVDGSVIAFLRTDRKGRSLLCVVNFTPVFHPLYRLGLPHAGTLAEAMNTDWEVFGGSNQYNAYELSARPDAYAGFPYSVEICVPPLSCVYFHYRGQRSSGFAARPIRSLALPCKTRKRRNLP
ncbi:MAG: alpha amylase C-terminal domain-containing protein [Eubacteriales bacterium]|nr:alpha amylase C-terminal domain-containing protein [Eubacteriales bacterium]